MKSFMMGSFPKSSVFRPPAAFLAQAHAPPPAANVYVGRTRVVARESGQVERNLPVHALEAGAPPLLDNRDVVVARHDVPGLPGGFVLSDVLSPAECARITAAADAMGWTEDAPVSLGRNVRRNTNCVWCVDEDTLNREIFERCASKLPAEVVGGGALRGLNARWRLYRYDAATGDVFRPHTDGAWPGSGLVDGELVHDVYKDGTRSWLTFLLFLTTDFEGGETTFFLEDGTQPAVRTPLGGALCFFHGEHALSPLHEGSLVTSGVKYVARTDVLYSTPLRHVA